MTKELIALSFEFRLTCENVLFASTAALGFIFMCFVFIFCLGYNVVSVHCGFKRKLDKETSTHLYDKDKSLPERNRQQSSEKYRRNIKNIRKSILRELVPEPGKIIAADVQRHPSQKFTKNQLHVQQIQNNLHSNAATRNHDHIGQRNPNRFQTRPVDFAACSPVKNCPAIDADSPVISKPSDKTVVCKVHRTQRNLNRFHKREEDENPWTEEKLYLPSHTDSIDVFKSCDKTDVREDEYPEEQDWETGSDDIENTSSAKEVDSDIQSISDCINDPYGDSNSFLLQASNDSDLETDAILNNGPREKCDTEYLRSNSDMEPGKYIPDRGRRARSKQDIRNKRYASIRKKKKSCPSSAKKSEETIIRAENIMIGKHNKLILSEDIKLDNIKQTLDNIKQTGWFRRIDED